eukprot:XP_016658398.1 PREDICTED: uncharacterized protein LOC107883251 [Acyrthosiphon pisum]
MTSTIGHLYRNIIRDEVVCVQYLKDRGLLLADNPMTCIKVKDGVVCNGQLVEYLRSSKKRNSDGTMKKVVTLRCTKRGCQTYQSIRKDNDFFTYTDLNGRCNSQLSLCEIMEIVWFWVNLVPNNQAVNWTGRSKNTIVDWYNLCRDIPVYCFSKREKMGGTGCTVQIDESLFQGKKKYNRGRLQRGDHQPLREISNSSNEDSDENEIVRTNKNYGNRIVGPWVFGICWKRPDLLLERRFFIVEKRDRETLLQIIKNEIKTGTTIYSDQWRAYSTLNHHGYIHQTVNHSEFFIDPETGAHTQQIEGLWRIMKSKYNIKKNGASPLLDQTTPRRVVEIGRVHFGRKR